uniref:Putative secreted protein n=1 Tax=Ixodes ricinus TaxID=34613 RepID=A0A147BBR2_IXORI
MCRCPVIYFLFLSMPSVACSNRCKRLSYGSRSCVLSGPRCPGVPLAYHSSSATDVSNAIVVRVVCFPDFRNMF